mmetsp:Transcript_9008/g.10177  ORF Transcript_9008/g.10177 Transcript_9008/m.10177 type:complete len:109 (+) Transcript_9008:29-355(+)
MLTEDQYQTSITFIKDFQDALHCIEQINERKASIDHYESFGSLVLSSMKKNQIKLSEKGFTKGDNISNFPLISAFKYSEELINKYKFATATSRDDLLKKFSKATQDLI